MYVASSDPTHPGASGRPIALVPACAGSGRATPVMEFRETEFKALYRI